MKRFLEFVNENKNTMRLYYSDKLRKIFTKISNSSSEEAKKIANFLILAEDSNQMEDKYTLIDVTDRNDYISHMQVNRIHKEFPGKDDKVENNSKFWTNDKIRTEHKVGKWVTHIYKNVYKTTFTTAQIEEFSNVYKATYDGIDNLPDFVILKGDDIKWGYLESNYSEGSGTLANSCMRYPHCQTYFGIYTDNEDVCSLLVLKDSNNKVKGRALLWKLEDNDLYMDRIYIANDSDKYLFVEWANEHNYRKYSNDYKSKSVKVGKDSYDYYPFMDTFISFDTNNRVLRSVEDSTCIKLQDTHGGYSESGVWSDYAGEHICESEAVWIESINDYVHQDDAVYLEYKDVYEIYDINYRSIRNLPALVHSECEETWLYLEDSAYSEILEDYVNVYEDDYVLFQINSDGDTDIIPDNSKYSHLYKVVNDETYSIDYVKDPFTDEYGFWSDIIYDIRNKLVGELGEDSTKVHSELIDMFLEFKPDDIFLKKIQDNDTYDTILKTYYGISSSSKPIAIEMLPLIYMGVLIEIDVDDTKSFWPSERIKNKLNYILNLIDDEKLTNSYKVWIDSRSMMRDFIKFAYCFDYTIFGDDIYKRILYNRIFR